jgi:hypothetical protein
MHRRTGTIVAGDPPLPIKSWSFIHNGHPIRAEIWWRFSGWNRRRLYVDHRQAAGRRGWFFTEQPLVADIDSPDGGKQKLKVCFGSSWNWMNKTCRFGVDCGPLAEVPSTRVYKRLQYHPEDGEEIQNAVLHNAGCLIIFGFLLVMCVVYGPLMIAGGVIVAFNEKRRRARLRKLGRCLSWPDVERRMELLQSPSTLIVQTANLVPARTWWTEEDVLAKSPLPLPDETRIQHPSIQMALHPLNEWCQFKYFDEKTGSAFLTDLPSRNVERLRLFEDENNPARLHAIYPNLNVVVVGFTGGEREKAAAEYFGILGDEIVPSMPALIGGVTSDNKAIRQMCVETIRLAGVAAEGAIPILEAQLYLTTHGERLEIANTLAVLGPSGVDVLKGAVKCGDLSIRECAQSALSVLARSTAPTRRPRGPVTPSVRAADTLRRQRRALWRLVLFASAFLTAVAVSAWFLGTWVTLAGAAIVDDAGLVGVAAEDRFGEMLCLLERDVRREGRRVGVGDRFQHHWPVAGQGAVPGVGELLGLFDLDAAEADGVGERRVREIGQFLAGYKPHVAHHDPLFPRHLVQIAVVQHQRDPPRVGPFLPVFGDRDAGVEAVHLHRAVARDGDADAVGETEFRADRVRHGRPHRRQIPAAAGHHAAAGTRVF